MRASRLVCRFGQRVRSPPVDPRATGFKPDPLESKEANLRKFNTLLNELPDFYNKCKLFDNTKSVTPNTITFNMLIQSCVQENDLLKAILLFEKEMPRYRVQPDDITFLHLLNACYKTKRPEMAFRIYNELKKQKFTPTAMMMNRMIYAAILSREQSKIQFILQEMKMFSIQNSSVTYNLMIGAAGEIEDWNIIEKLMNNMIEEGFSPDAHTFSHLIVAFVKGKQYEKAIEGFERMKKQDIIPTVSTFCAMILCYLKQKNISEAYNLFKEGISIHKKLAPIVYWELIIHEARQGNANAAAELLRETMKLNFSGGREAYNALLELYIDNKDELNVRSLIQEMKARDLRIDVYLFANVPNFAYKYLRDSYSEYFD